MDKLSKLFGSAVKVKVMRLFLFNPGSAFDNKEIVRRAGVRSDSVRKVLSVLLKSGLIKKKALSVSATSKQTKTNKKKKGAKSSAKKRVQGWVLDEASPYIGALRTLLLPADALSDSEIEKKFKKTGKVKLLVLSGAFLHSDGSRVDVFIVADKINSGQLSSAVKDLEAHVGTELRYAVLAPEEFRYRMNIRDKLVRDIFDSPHKIIFDKLGL